MQNATITPPLPNHSPITPRGSRKNSSPLPPPLRGGEQFVTSGESSEGESLPRTAARRGRKVFALPRPRLTAPPSGVMLAGEE